MNRNLHYNYDIQAWVEDGKVLRCGHPAFTNGCYSCAHHGEEEPSTPEAAKRYFHKLEGEN